jgi:hypothetical protein
MKTRIAVTTRKPAPRNPLVAPSLFRHAGAHRSRAAAMQRQQRRLLKSELEQLHPPRL